MARNEFKQADDHSELVARSVLSVPRLCELGTSRPYWHWPKRMIFGANRCCDRIVRGQATTTKMVAAGASLIDLRHERPLDKHCQLACSNFWILHLIKQNVNTGTVAPLCTVDRASPHWLWNTSIQSFEETDCQSTWSISPLKHLPMNKLANHEKDQSEQAIHPPERVYSTDTPISNWAQVINLIRCQAFEMGRRNTATPNLTLCLFAQWGNLQLQMSFILFPMDGEKTSSSIDDWRRRTNTNECVTTGNQVQFGSSTNLKSVNI